MGDRAPYSRVYWTIVDDPKFATIYDDDHHLAAWLRMLLVHDQAHPASGQVPSNCQRASVKALVDAGLVDRMGGRFRIHGLDAERERRANRTQTGPNGTPNGTQLVPQTGGSSALARALGRDEDETRRDETRTSRANAREVDDGRVDLEAFLIIKRRAPSARQRKLLDDVLDRRDLTGPAWAADVMYRHPDDPIGAVIEADREWRAQRIAEAQAAERPKPKPRRSPGLPQTTREIMAEMALLQRETTS